MIRRDMESGLCGTLLSPLINLPNKFQGNGQWGGRRNVKIMGS